MLDKINTRFRYDFFIIWGNGLDYTSQIIDILNKENFLHIIRINNRKIKNMKKFVWRLYYCDSVPTEHLQLKLNYLYKTKKEIIIIIVKNLKPQEMYFGDGQFRHIQCEYIKYVKEKIRDMFNPRKNNKRTEEHVVHASDYEEQVDYLLKMLGSKSGIKIFQDAEILPFEKPYHISSPKQYIFKKIPLDALRAKILFKTQNNRILTKELSLNDTPHYKSLIYGKEFYEQYYEPLRYTYLTDNHFYEKFILLNQLELKEFNDLTPVIVQKNDNHYTILDGVHRSVVAYNKKLDSINCVEFFF